MPDQMTRWQQIRALPRVAQWATGVAVVLVLALVAVTVTAVVLVRKPLPTTSGDVDVPGLSAPVDVVRDDNGIPQIYADTLDDLMRAQGYVQAQERFFEMDVRRHITAGRTAELFGESGLETDKFIRTMGWRDVAEREVALLDPQTRDALEAYSAGVNAYIDQHSPSQMAVEYSILAADGLDYSPEPWTPTDTVAWLKAMAWDLRGNMTEEIDRALLSVDHSTEEIAELYPPYPYGDHAPIVNQGAVVDGVYEQDATGGGSRDPLRPGFTADQARPFRALKRAVADVPALLGRGDGIGSNSWVVDGEHSATGQPLLANDPHLGVSQPGIWMQMGLHCRRVGEACPIDASGFTFSGVPGVIIGHNADIAWGFTNLGPDVTDLYLEKVRGSQWYYDGRYRPLEVRTETIEVRGGEDFELTIRETGHGPLLSDVSGELSTIGANARPRGGPDPGNGYAVSLAWTALQPSTTAEAIFDLNTAGNWQEFRNAASKFAVPAQNLVYADRFGHIGYQAPGRVPIRKSGNDGRTPSEGWLPENDWSGQYVPFSAMPTVLDPDEGFVATANQAVVGAAYPYYLTSDWDYGYRSQRIRELLLDEQELSVDDMAQMQLDDRNAIAEELVPYLLEIRLDPGYTDDGQRLLEGWDFTQPADSAPAAYFNIVWRLLLEKGFGDDLRSDAQPLGGSRWYQVVSRMLQEPDSSWWDDSRTEGRVETRDDVLKDALVEARDEATRLMARNPADWEWGRLHRLNLHNQTLGESGIGPVEALVNRDGYRIGGGGSIVNATGWEAPSGYDVTTAPSMRMVVSMADFDDSRWINLTGVSGHPGSGHYDDQTDLFVAGETLPWAFSRGAVDEAAEDTLTLRPAR